MGRAELEENVLLLLASLEDASFVLLGLWLKLVVMRPIGDLLLLLEL